MFKKLEVLDSKQHSELKYKPAPGYAFARQLHGAPLIGPEIAEASKHYPIVFPVNDDADSPQLPMAIFSLKSNENAFVDDQGIWKAAYIPVHIRRYPFLLTPIKDSNRFAVMIDREAAQFQNDDGTRLFNENGEASDIVTQAKNFLGRYQADVVQTSQLVEMLMEKDVLVQKQFDINKGKDKHSIRGFRVVDTKKLSALDDETLARWVRNGLMGIIIGHLHSLNNVNGIAQRQQMVPQNLQ